MWSEINVSGKDNKDCLKNDFKYVKAYAWYPGIADPHVS